MIYISRWFGSNSCENCARSFWENSTQYYFELLRQEASMASTWPFHCHIWTQYLVFDFLDFTLLKVDVAREHVFKVNYKLCLALGRYYIHIWTSFKILLLKWLDNTLKFTKLSAKSSNGFLYSNPDLCPAIL